MSTALIWTEIRVTRPLELEVPKGQERVGQLAQYLAVWNPQLFTDTDGLSNWTPERVRLTVREIIKDQLGLNDFNDDDSFVKDLHMD